MPEEKPSSTLTKEEVNIEKDLVAWTAPLRPFKRWGRDFYVKILAIASIFGVIIYFIEGVLPVILIISSVFLFYILSTVEPENIEYKITTLGIKIGKKLTRWNLMNRFWFVRRMNSEILTIETLAFPGRLEIIIRPELKDQIIKAISRYLTHEEVPPSFLDKASGWVSQRILENK